MTATRPRVGIWLRTMIFFIGALGAAAELARAQGDQCQVLFGRINAKTGLTADQCQDNINCGGLQFQAPEYSEEHIAWLSQTKLDNPLPVMTQDPYKMDFFVPIRGQYCGLVFDPERAQHYRMQTYSSLESLLADGAHLTHTGSCGACSSLKNLAAYIRHPDLTDPVSDCTIRHFWRVPGRRKDKIANCIMQAVGFDRACSMVWYYNTNNTRSSCIDKCWKRIFSQNSPWAEKNHRADGSLNECIQCDETASGPIFKMAAGRTRRNSGLPSGLCRPPRSVAPIEHFYPGSP